MGLIQLSALTSGTISGNSTQQDELVIHDAGVTASLTVAFPTSPTVNQEFCVCSVGGITVLSMTSGVTIVTALTTMAAGGNGTWVYSGVKWCKTK